MEPLVLGIHSLGGFAVLVFFTLSGYLVTTSWLNDPNVFRFAARRALRVWPALISVVLFSTYVLGTWLTELRAADYLRNPGTSAYLANIWLETRFALPGVFLHNPHAGSVNGSIWTIPFEVLCYAILATVGMLGILRFRKTSVVLILLACIAYQVKLGPDFHSDWGLRWEMMVYFFVGCLICLIKPYWENRRFLWFTVLSLVGLALYLLGFRYLGLMIGLSFAIIYFGISSTPVIRQFGRWGDPSYGLYLIAFPIQQTIIQLFWPSLGFTATLALTIAVTTVLAYLSWHLLEKKALQLKPRRSRAKKSFSGLQPVPETDQLHPEKPLS